MIALYRDSFRTLRQASPLILGLAVVIEALPRWFPSMRDSSIPAFAISVIYAYSIHRQCLLGEAAIGLFQPASSRSHHRGKFMLVTGALLIPVVVATVYAGVRLGAGRSEEAAYGLIVVFALPASLVVLTLFGTALPAAAAGDPLGPTFGMARIRACSARIFVGLLAGPALVGFVGIGLLVLLSYQVYPETFAFGVAETALGIVNTTFAVVVLCRAYRRVVPGDAPPRSLGASGT